MSPVHPKSLARFSSNGQRSEEIPKIRCAIYTRKSLKEGLDEEFNTLDAQRDAAENYIKSQVGAGWVLLPTLYNDGGFSGSHLDRPAFKQLMVDIQAGLIDCVVVYKVDRLSRSIMDFTAIWEQLATFKVDFVSVTEQFNTSVPAGRLQLNMILSFAQYERELIGERTRDKMSAARRKGKYMGGMVPLGYMAEDKKLIIQREEAKLVERIFKRYTQTHSALLVIKELNDEGVGTKVSVTKKGIKRGGQAWTSTAIYKILNNRLYLGEVVHGGEIYPGEHDAIIERHLFDAVQEGLAGNAPAKSRATRIGHSGFLDGLVRCAECGSTMTPSNTTKNGVKYRYYRCVGVQKQGAAACTLSGIPTTDVEKHTFAYLIGVFQDSDMVERILEKTRDRAADFERADILSSLRDLHGIWDELFVAEQQRIAAHLIERVQIGLESVQVQLCGGDVVDLPLKARRRCGRLRLVTRDQETAVDHTSDEFDSLSLSIAKGFKWLEELDRGDFTYIKDLADHYAVEEAYVRKHLKLALLPPAEVERVLANSEAASAQALFEWSDVLW